jgi:hypothetical protein
MKPASIRDGEACYVDDARAEPLHELAILCDDQGDVYVMVRPVGHRMGPAVRLCASGGADRAAPGLLQAMRAAHAAIRSAALPEGAEQRERSEWKQRAEAVVRRLAAERDTLNSDDVWDAMAGDRPPDPRLLGAVMMKLAGTVIEKTGEQVKTKWTARRGGRSILVWRSIRPGAAPAPGGAA